MTTRAESQIALTRVDDGALDEVQLIQLQNLKTDVNGGTGYVLSDIIGEFAESEILVNVNRFLDKGESQTFVYTTEWEPSLEEWGVINEAVAVDGDTFTVTLTDTEGIDATVEAQGEEIVTLGDTVQQQAETLVNIQGDVEDVAQAVSEELVAKGYAKITAAPSVELGRTESAWKMFITNVAIQLVKNSSPVASLAQDADNPNETTLKADNARLANIKLRSADSRGKLGIVAQSNGHVSMKEI